MEKKQKNKGEKGRWLRKTRSETPFMEGKKDGGFDSDNEEDDRLPEMFGQAIA